MLWLEYTGVCLLAYLLGSLPVGYLAAKAIGGVDIRQIGSGHTGGTNVLRSAGLLAGGLTVVADLAKGYAAVTLARMVLPDQPLVAAIAGILAVVGHNHSVFLGWRGGVGSMTTLGAALALMPLATAIIFVVGAAIILILRYSSVASLTAAVLLPLICLVGVIRGSWPPAYLLFAMGSALLSVWELRHNIKRLRLGTERRVGQTVAPDSSDAQEGKSGRAP
jgi:glycerol-3-phosphate acyltransferase PlsY